MKVIREFLNRLEPYVSQKKRFSRYGVRIVNYRSNGNLIRKLKNSWQQYITTIPDYPGDFDGKGIVICGGGLKYFTCAWVNLALLRKGGCKLPVELWYTGDELTPEVINELHKSGVVCKNAKDYSSAGIGGFALKPLAILHSRFKEVLFLDADNNCTSDPTYLFETEEYKKYGTIFWPDMWTTDYRNPIWKIVDSRDFSSMEQESGQLIINKEKCWKELNLAMYFNLNSEHYYKMLLGDKDTFRFAWIGLKTPFYMIETPVAFCGFMDKKANKFLGMSMVQHDPQGQMLMIHRNLLKWDVTTENDMIWSEIKRFKSLEDKRILMGLHEHAETGARYNSIDIQGDVEKLQFHDVFGSLEHECFAVLTSLRAMPFYGRFLLYTYFQIFNPTHRARSRVSTGGHLGQKLLAQVATGNA